jgi:hypothetical protein
MKTNELFQTLQEISKMQVEAIKDMDSGWKQIRTGYEDRGIRDYKRMMYLDKEPTKQYIDAIFAHQETPAHNSRSHLIVAEPENGLWVLTLNVTMDSSD